MNTHTRNWTLAVGIASGLLSLPVTWFTMKLTGFLGALVQNASGDGLHCAVSLAGARVPVWLLVVLSVVASVLLLDAVRQKLAPPAFLLWIVAVAPAVFLIVGSVMAISNDQVRPQLGFFMGLVCALAPVVVLVMPRLSANND